MNEDEIKKIQEQYTGIQNILNEIKTSINYLQEQAERDQKIAQSRWVSNLGYILVGLGLAALGVAATLQNSPWVIFNGVMLLIFGMGLQAVSTLLLPRNLKKAKVKKYMKYRDYKSLSEDISSCWVWIGQPVLPSRSIIKLTCSDTGKSIICEALNIDENYKSKYNESSRTINIKDNQTAIVISEWYRKHLGLNLDNQRDYEFLVERKDNCCGKLRASLQHPQNIIRIATLLAIISVVSGLSGLILGLISLKG